MKNGVQVRAEIDTESVKGLLLINGGGAVALLAFLPHVLGTAEYRPLVLSILIGLLFFQTGLISAVIHNHFRRRCSLEYSKNPEIRPPCKRKFISLFRATPNEPCICCKSWMWMWFSAIAFFLAGVSVAVGGFIVLVC
jgi:hypothetical protein